MDRDLEALLDQLTAEQQAVLTCGADLWSVAGLPEHGVPAVKLTDGPNGARGGALPGASRVAALCVPCGSALGATWDPELVAQVGAALGEEARTKGARVLLAPTVNLPRSPLFGRSFECYSEDPLLSGALAAGFVQGVQSRGVAATLKHLVGNEAERERLTMSSDVDERALRELYLVPFEQGVRAGAMAVMTAYNRLNGRWCAEDADLVAGWLRGELGFDGVVMTDWFAVGSTHASARATVDLQMPGPDRFFGAPLAAAVRSGEVAPELLRASAGRWLSLIDRLGAWDDHPRPEQAVELPEHRRLARRAASDGTVLLRNDALLPLSPRQTVALIGPAALHTQVMGGGSAQLRPHRSPTLAEVLPGRVDRVLVEPGCVLGDGARPVGAAFTTRFRGVEEELVEPDGRLFWVEPPLAGVELGDFAFTATATLRVTETGEHRFALSQSGRARVSLDGTVVIDGVRDVPGPGTAMFGLGSAELDHRVHLTAGAQVELAVDYVSTGSLFAHGVLLLHEPPRPADLLERAVQAAADADCAVLVVGTGEEGETEGRDRHELRLPGDQEELVRRVTAANRRTAVVVNAGAPVDLRCADQAAAVLVGWLGGQEMAEALVDVLLGEAEPAGRLPVSWPLRIEHTPAFGAFPGENDHVRYAEGLLSGYRWYDSRALPTAFPFGHGMSYTSFAWGEPVLSTRRLDPGGAVVVEVDVTNTGARAGAEVVQLYVEPLQPRLSRPRRELKAFAKVWAAPGETVAARLVLEPRSFAYWDPGSAEHAHLRSRLGPGEVVPAEAGPDPIDEPGWRVDAGPHRLLLARSVEDVIAVIEVEVGWSGPAA